MRNFHTALTRATLAAVLALCTSLACSAPVFDPSLQPYGNVPPVGLTGFNLSTGTQRAFQPWFDPYNWSGDLSAYPVSVDGRTQLASKIWSARAVFGAKQACYASSPSGSVSYYDTGRHIVTRGGATPAKIGFRWASLSATEQASIGDATNGPKIVNFVRGDRSNEVYDEVLAGDGTVLYSCGVPPPGTGLFRTRASILGDMIHTRPVYVAGPPADYLFDSYQTFKTANAARAPRVYIGANDGMVHAFDAADGSEVWAYIPSMLLGKLKQLATDPYAHTYYIDGGMAAGDANIGTSASPNWRTVLVGGLGAGGKGLFALDVTSPSAGATEAATATSKILWEITPSTAGFGSLGYTYGDPVVVRLNTGQWAAIVGNGYLNGGTGTAVLYIIDIATGNLIKALDTGSGSLANPNGLSSPIAVDVNFDGKVDRVYAGDIDGNLWKFDISGSTAASWPAPTALYASGKAIVGAPEVAAHPVSGVMVYFATGRMFTAADGADATVQNYAYGIWDGAPAANTTLLSQTLTEKLYGSQRVRVTSGLPINWNDNTNILVNPLHRGWRIALPPGERAIGTGFVRDGRYHVATVNPAVVHTTKPDGENWLNEFEYETGGAKDKPIFDLNSDSLLNDADRVVDAGGDPVAGPTGIPVAVYMGAGLLSQPVLAIINANLSTTIFNFNPYASPADQPAIPPAPNIDPGVRGGHFDVDIYYASTNDHHHEYDDTYDVTGVNFLNPSDPVFDIKNAISGGGTKFKVLIANQRLSPAVVFSVGGSAYKPVYEILTTAGMTMASLPTYTRNDVATLKFKMDDDAMESRDWGTGEVRAGLHPTQTGCVRGKWPTDTGTFGPNGEYRNGALTFQLVKDTTPDSAIQLAGPGGDPRYGYRLKSGAAYAGYRLAEWTTFWHHPNKLCMGDGGWNSTPPIDTSVSNKFTWPAAGSQDPPYDELGAVTSSVTTTVADGTCSGCTIRTTTVSYSTGAKLIVTEWIDNKGNVKKVTTVLIPPPPGGGGGGGGSGAGTGQGGSSPNTVTGYQQTRNVGKLGRITWHEMYRQ